jgi:hypothetical protein
VGIGLGLAGVVLGVALAFSPRHVYSLVGVTESVCPPGGVNADFCILPPHPVKAIVEITDCRIPAELDQEFSTSQDGRFQLDLSPGRYCVTARDGYAGAGAYVTVVAGKTATIKMTLRVYSMAQCLAAGDQIDSPTGPILVAKLHAGMTVWTLDAAGRRVAAQIVLVTHTPAPPGHHVLRISFSDGRVVEASPGHPTADGRQVGDLKPGDMLDGSRVISIDSFPYVGDTWDLLPAGPSGTYWVNGILLGSTLRANSPVPAIAS